MHRLLSCPSSIPTDRLSLPQIAVVQQSVQFLSHTQVLIDKHIKARISRAPASAATLHRKANEAFHLHIKCLCLWFYICLFHIFILIINVNTHSHYFTITLKELPSTRLMILTPFCRAPTFTPLAE